jgi:hypothetical protein
MEILIGILCFLWILSLVVFIIIMARAPIGFENESGFNYGDEQSSTVSSNEEKERRVLSTKTSVLFSS